ncbi:YbaN family protein [Phenylobacterium sp. J367]|uniref:YbaN family protein n=1 Tax=Phenylobacterium sp. J367 TaxID=2898435 RepID=UPI00215144DA|nr:YbaN family protein [Phenylobacterium sp. J367]MCR5880915.1 YbaN family protein [Phenylobacterium sp. J367]
MSVDPPDTPPELSRPGRAAVLAWRTLGIVCVGLATAGVFLPLLPTTIFLIAAVWAFAKGSPEWAEKVRAHPRLGPYIRDWEARRAIPRRAKVLAVGMMAASWMLLLFATHSLLLAGGVGALLIAVASYVVTRPSA